ncbi:unnamed protein product [Heligmosomoides polygyrus]|uniref:LIM/homeobox protein Awh n=1 Tax=Heligmosomoides polygyrus TaxID=6339 RepID=A0A183GD64_HELPZ|nr:unnamed protein product [Heligmosomoides polygyrus]
MWNLKLRPHFSSRLSCQTELSDNVPGNEHFPDFCSRLKLLVSALAITSCRQFGTKCASCSRLIHATDWVRRARSHVFHLACFACAQCKRQLSTGEEFALQDNRLLCKQHFVEFVDGDSGSSQQKQKIKRVRTTFAEEQLSVLQAHFQVDSNPDGADLERIANITGLSKRVTQVWFQNSRARQKKYQGSRKSCDVMLDNIRSSEGPASPSQKSEASSDGMFPSSVMTSTVRDSLP